MRDELFIRGNAPMTKSEVRAIAISKLELSEDSVLYDVGAGTGSVSLEAAALIKSGIVFAVEKKQEAVELIKKNQERFHADQIQVVAGTAPEVLEGLPAPTHVFVGGSSGNIREIIGMVRKKNSGVRVVITAVTLETLSDLLEFVNEEGIEAELVQIQVSRAEKAGRYHLMRAGNPVFILSFGGKEVAKDETALS